MRMGATEAFNDTSELAAGIGITVYLVIAWGVTSYVAFSRAKRGEMLMPDYDRCLAGTRRMTLGCTDACNPRTCCSSAGESAQESGSPLKALMSSVDKRTAAERKAEALLDEAMATARGIVSAVEEMEGPGVHQYLWTALGEDDQSSDEEEFDDEKALEIEAKEPKRYVLAGPEDVALKRKWDHPYDEVEFEEEMAEAATRGVGDFASKYLPKSVQKAMKSWIVVALKLCAEGYFFVAPSFSLPIRWNRSRPANLITTSVYILGMGLAFFDPRQILGIASSSTGDACALRPDGSDNTSPECLHALSESSLWKVAFWVVIAMVYSPLLGFVGALPWGVGPHRIHLFGRTSKWGKIGKGRLPLTLFVWFLRLLFAPLLVPILFVTLLHKVDQTFLFKTLYSYFISTMFGALACRYQNMEEADTPAYLVSDPGVTCWNSDIHWAAAGLAIPAIPLYVVLGHQNALKALGGVDFEEPSMDHQESGLTAAGVPPFKLFKRALFYDSWWAEVMINGKMLLSTSLAFLGPSGREDITWLMLFSIFLVNLGLFIAHLYMWPCTLDWINVLQQTIFAVATWSSIMAMTAHYLNDPDSQGPNAGLYGGAFVIILVSLYLVPKARLVSEHDSGIAGNMLYAVERRAKNLKRQRDVADERKRIRGLQAGWTAGVGKLLGGLASLGGMFRSRYTKARNQLKDEIGRVQERYFKEALANLDQVDVNLKKQAAVVASLSRHWHARYSDQLTSGTAWDRAKRNMKMMFEYERKMYASCVVATQDNLDMREASRQERKDAREKTHKWKAARDAEVEQELKKLIEEASKLEETYSTHHEQHQLLTARRRVLSQEMEDEVNALLNQDLIIQEKHKAGEEYEMPDEVFARKAAAAKQLAAEKAARAKEEAELAAKRAKEEAEQAKQRAKEEAQLAAKRAKEKAEQAKRRAKEEAEEAKRRAKGK